MSNYAIMIGGEHFSHCNEIPDEELLDISTEFLSILWVLF